ncbi:riboflavin synthase [Candidatus Woesearchaeota archaeon]|jgi:riboflavin synthase|nr:riboflavin synthase [Candidatus Woesearchaeota archaeon]MAH33595.1 riboflavin synthase [archaeon]MDP6548435.1 riboflavin synthase [Candidatus Woesearchaeota archaeon]MDP7263155.1 riboflavin synthase [Candidatus Woesearchaeota archaeon]MDP7622532.1 riboflavin synthase [Candidatus Woesearchaeota archaeon]|tara:strand:+ start:26268 stop:26732 length:465 start_codon:yes stop_codon:yes gene_type:complete
MAKIGIADTTFARVDMAGFAIGVINNNSEHEIERYTVPGFKDLPVACKLLFEKYKCDIVMAFGMAGPEPIDKQCSHEASMGMQMVQVEAGKHILEVFVHMDESEDEKEIFEIAKNRAEKHALNALVLLEGKEALTKNAGMGKRQGKDDEGEIKV